MALPKIEVIATKEIAGVQRHHHSWTAQNALLLAFTIRKHHSSQFDYEAVVE
jgi:hypothetical protein